MTYRTFVVTLDGRKQFPKTDRDGYDGADWEAVMDACGFTEPDETRIEETTEEKHGFPAGSLLVYQPGCGYYVLCERE